MMWHIPARRRAAKTVDDRSRRRRMVASEMVEKKGKGRKEEGKRKAVAGKRLQTVVFLLLPFDF